MLPHGCRYDVLKSVGGLTNEELAAAFDSWNKSELESFLVEITADIFKVKDDLAEGHLVDKILDKTGMKGTGKWTVQQAAELSIAAPTIAASLDSRFLSGLKDERVAAAKVYKGLGVDAIQVSPKVDKKELIDDVRKVSIVFCCKNRHVQSKYSDMHTRHSAVLSWG